MEMSKIEDKYYCCKWCGNCMNTDLKNNKGKCFTCDELIEDTEKGGCCDFYFDKDLDRC